MRTSEHAQWCALLYDLRYQSVAGSLRWWFFHHWVLSVELHETSEK